MRLEQAPARENSVERAQRELKHELFQVGKLVGLFLVLFLLLQTFVVEWVPVNGPSMLPTVAEGDRILVYKLPRQAARLPLLGGLAGAAPGDIVVYYSAADRKRYVKRVAAAGPPLRGRHAVNARALAEGGGGTPVRFDRGTLFVNNQRVEEPYLTEAERHSPDIFETVLAPGEYYLLGDHRSVSKDSRRTGPVHEEEILGRAVFRFWPPSRFGRL